MDEYLKENDSSMVLRCLLHIYEEYLAKIDNDFLHLLADDVAIVVSPAPEAAFHVLTMRRTRVGLQESSGFDHVMRK
uniref:Uncharacterized protein n=1 Tax=Tanacetum cinerariifolium TaxID=118510 RepID=A0A6L2N258_TANCI|nr:hypothetical protein [Tanacetum cinerariifolium]